MSSQLLKEIEDYQNTYYNDNNKNLFFKSNQKNNLASNVSEKFDMNQLLKMMCYPIINTNIVIIDYYIFKMFANTNNYKTITDFILGEFEKVLKMYNKFECHLNINTFTISAAERYKTMINIFCEKALASNTQFSEKIDKFIIYYPPSMIQNISKIFSPFINPNVKDKVIFYDKKSSDLNWNKYSKYNKDKSNLMDEIIAT
jgi:hypothetical protein